MSQEKFDLTKVHACFDRCLTGDEDDVFIDPYLEGFKELYKFFSLMGTVFGFVSSDVKEKVEILEKHRQQPNAEKFESVRRMMEYERDAELLTKKDYVSGSRTLLRLHRGLDFIYVFLKRLGELTNPDDKTNAVCQTSYNETLAQFHPWLIRKGATVAMYALPNRDQLLEKVCVDAPTAIRQLPEMLVVARKVYDRTQDLYTKYDLHGLP